MSDDDLQPAEADPRRSVSGGGTDASPPQQPEPTPDSFRDLFSEHTKDEIIDVLYEQTQAAVAVEQPPPALDVERLAAAIEDHVKHRLSFHDSMSCEAECAADILARLSGTEPGE